jgi:hypothetical protein
VEKLGKIPFASIEVEKIWYGWIIAYYVIIGYLIYYLRQKDKSKLKENEKK